MPTSNTSPFANGIRRRVSGCHHGDEVEVLVASRPPDVESATSAYDVPWPLSSTASSSHGSRDVVACHTCVPTFGVVQLKDRFVWLHKLVSALAANVTEVASDVVSLNDRITAVEGTPTSLVHDQETAALARQADALRELVASQEDRIAGLERSQHAETESNKKTIQELTTYLDNMKDDDDDNKTPCDDAFENLCQSFKNLQQSMECQAARLTCVKAEAARKIALLQSELAGVQAELSTVNMTAVLSNALPAS